MDPIKVDFTGNGGESKGTGKAAYLVPEKSGLKLIISIIGLNQCHNRALALRLVAKRKVITLKAVIPLLPITIPMVVLSIELAILYPIQDRTTTHSTQNIPLVVSYPTKTTTILIKSPLPVAVSRIKMMTLLIVD